MFVLCRFYFDQQGNKLPDVVDLTAEDVGGTAFMLNTVVYYREPAISIHRIRDSKKKGDPYDDNGSGAPSVWGHIVYPHIEFMDYGVILTGLEAPNMMWAGQARAPYEGNPQLALSPERIWNTDRGPEPWKHLDNLKRQKVYLSALTPAKQRK